jgi:hypothetical protein
MPTPTHPGTIAGSLATLARTVTGAPVAADSTTLVDATFDPTAGVLCAGWKSVAIFARLTGGTAPTWSLQALFRMGPTTTTANAWTTSPIVPDDTLTDGQFTIVEVGGRLIFPRIHAVTGAPTTVDIYVAGWTPLDRLDAPRVS